MANNRRIVQEAHERFSVGLLIYELNRRHRSLYRVIAEPNPPEAIIQSNKTIRWVEVTTAFWSKEFTQDIYSYATEGEEHRPIKGHVFAEPDAKFAIQFVDVVKQKLEKYSYIEARDMYGSGYLVVPIQYPAFSRDTWHYMQRAWSRVEVQDKKCFQLIYITYRVFDGYKVSLWRPQ